MATTESVQTIFSWDEQYETGLSDIDDQHKYLVNLINQFGLTLGKGDDSVESQATVQQLLNDLDVYAQFHFAEEEALMSMCNVDHRHYFLHLCEHQRFVEQVSQAKENWQTDMDSSVIQFLTNWLINHILGDDQDMALQVRLIKEGLSPSEAYLQATDSKRDATQPLLSALNRLYRHVHNQNRAMERLAATNLQLEQKLQQITKN